MNQEFLIKQQKLANEVLEELFSAYKRFESFNSSHEGYAVILEELDELWEEVKKKNSSKILQRSEAIQVAAMAMRFINDLC